MNGMKLIVKLLWFIIDLYKWDHPTFGSVKMDELEQEVKDYLEE